MTAHIKGKCHIDMAKAGSTSTSVANFFKPQTSLNVIEAEARWSLFVAKHNLSFMTSDHANKLFVKMFPNSEIARKFKCSRTKTTAIVKGALAPYFLNSTLESMDNPFSIMIDESNDKTDKSCIILVCVLDNKVCDICKRFLDMPVVNNGTAANLFDARKSSLAKHGFDFSNAFSYMSDTTNVMKGASRY